METVNPYIPNVEKFTKSEEFSYLASFYYSHKTYTLFPKGTLQYKQFWDDVSDKCLNGFTNTDGINITGQHFFYLNFVQIDSYDEVTGRKRKLFPQFVDLDYEYFWMTYYCKQEQKSLVAVKGRRQGWSYKAAAICTHEYSFYRESSCIIGAYLSTFSQETMNMVLSNCNFLNDNTEFKKQRNPDTKEFIMARYQVDDAGTKVWRGFHSKIETITYRNNEFAAVGKSATWLILDESGVFSNIIESYGMSEPLIKTGNIYSGVCLMFGSAGSMEAGSQYFKDIFTNPAKYNMLEFSNPKAASSNKIGFFSNAAKGRWGICRDPKSQWYKKPMVDKDGNSNIEAAKEDIIWERESKKKGGDIKAYQNFVTQYPIDWEEAFLITSRSPFPLHLIQERLAELETKQSITDAIWYADLVIQNDNIEFKISKKEPITIFPIRDKTAVNLDTCIEIYEQPYDDKPAYGVYIAGCLTPGEKVLTNVGLKNVEDINLTDKLINKDGELVDINTLLQYDKINEKVFNVEMSNVKRKTNFTAEHPLYLSDTFDGEYSFITVDKAKIGQWTKYPNIYNKEIIANNDIWNKHTKVKCKKIDNLLYNEDFWWFVGMWLGDGFCSNTGKNFTIHMCFGYKDTIIIDKYKNLVSKLFNRKAGLKSAKNSNALKFECSQLYSFLEDNFGKYANGKFIPEWVKYLPNNLKQQLILGYLDSDGSVFKDRDFINSSFTSINKTLLFGVQDILFSLGVVSNFNTHSKEKNYNINGKIGISKESYHLQINQTNTKILADLYITDHNSRKLKLAKTIEYKQKPRLNSSCIISEDKKYIYLKIKNIEENLYTGKVYNFDCVTHTFIVPYCTTHNCDPYDDDTADNSDSLGSCIIMNSLTNRVVAQYTARPTTAKEFYENVRRLLMYYNAIANYENNKKGIFAYFENKNCLHLLADTPKILKDQQIIKTIYESGNSSKGTNASKEVNKYARELYKTYLYEQAYDKPEGITNTHVIVSKLLLKETELWNIDGNFDRVSAMMMLMVLKEDRVKMIASREEMRYESQDEFFERNWQENKNSYMGPDFNSWSTSN